ncbi:M81 family metallopeptidase [Flavobacteriaceae bacterium]|nr:M81 family metallopeptidase [Flavobacteriaceae bacterium]
MTFFKTLFSAFTLVFLISSCKSDAIKPKIAIAGLAIESSTFSPATTEASAFLARKGNDIFNYYPFLEENSPQRNAAQWIPTLRGHALPGGIVTRKAYDSLVGVTLELLKENMPYDGLFFDIHGAMSVQGIDDPEGDFIEKIRALIGTETLISTSMDLHGNVSERLAKQTDLITCYRMAPHEDALESKQRAVDNLLERLQSGKGKPKYKAWIPVPILLPGEKTSTRIEPGKSLYAKVQPVTEREGVIDAAIWIGYAWADEPRNRAVVMVTGDDKTAVSESAEMLANHFWDVREEFDFVAPTATLEESLELALKATKKPFVISDMGDNPTAGGAGDVTWTLRELLSQPEFQSANGPVLIYASIPGPEMIKSAIEVGVGGKVKANVGALVDDRFAPPILLDGVVEAIHEGDIHAEVEAVIRVGSIRVIVTKKRKPYHHEKDFTQLGLDPRLSDILVVKIGYLVPELYDLRGDWIMALTPGGVDQDLERLGYKRVKRPIFPLDKEMTNVDLNTQWITSSELP